MDTKMAASNFTVIYDACVLFPTPLRDLLIRLAQKGIFRARWTQDIHHEWIENLLIKRENLQRKRIEKTAALMDKAIPDSLVYGYEPLIKGLSLPDKNDRHVLAAAIKGQAEVIVTFNLKDFPKDYLIEFDIWTQHPDEFISHLIDLHPQLVILAAKEQRQALKKPTIEIDDFLAILLRQQLPRTVTFLKQYKDLI